MICLWGNWNLSHILKINAKKIYWTLEYLNNVHNLADRIHEEIAKMCNVSSAAHSFLPTTVIQKICLTTFCTSITGNILKVSKSRWSDTYTSRDWTTYQGRWCTCRDCWEWLSHSEWIWKWSFSSTKCCNILWTTLYIGRQVSVPHLTQCSTSYVVGFRELPRLKYCLCKYVPMGIAKDSKSAQWNGNFTLYPSFWCGKRW